MSRRPAIVGRSAIVVVAAVVAGVVGFVLTFVVARTIGAAATAHFTAFWSAVYLIVGALAGLQQEVSRATRPRDESRGQTRDDRPHSLRRFTVIAVALVVVIVAGTGLLWVDAAFGAGGRALLLPLTVGPAGYVVVTIVCGELYGMRKWSSIAAMVVGDAVLRAIAVGVVLLITHDVEVIAWAVALPFGATVLILWWFVRRGVVGRFTIDVPPAALAANGLRAIAGSLATSVLISGFSLFVVATSHDASRAVIGALVFAITVVRAPVMIAVLAAQSLLVVHFRDGAKAGRDAFALAGAVLGGGVALAGIAAVVGDPILAFLVGPDFAVGPGVLFVIVASSALMGALLVAGPYAIARSRHTVYAAGWIVAAVVGLAALFLPLALVPRVELSLLAAPIAGIIVHVVASVRTRTSVAAAR